MDHWCYHRSQTTPRRDEDGEYRRCIECGKRIPWAWQSSFSRGAHRVALCARWTLFVRRLRAFRKRDDRPAVFPMMPMQAFSARENANQVASLRDGIPSFLAGKNM